MRNWKSWARAALIRAIRTFAEAALAYIGTGAVGITDVNWMGVLSAGAFGAVTSLLLALTGLPEADEKMDSEADGQQKQPPDTEKEN